MKLERSTKEDAEEVVRWMAANRPLSNASNRSLKGCTYWKIAGILHLPVKAVLMLESLAPNPAVTGKKRLLALRRAMNDLRKQYPHTEIIFLTKGGTMLDEAAKFYGFDELPYKVFRMRPDDHSRAKKVYGAEVATEEVRAYA
jgi:hypothetical protein